MSETDELEPELLEAFEADGVSTDQAAAAAEKAAAFAAEYELDIDIDEITDAIGAAPYESFQNRFDYVIGDFAQDIEDCTDSREFRLAGFGDLAADPEQGA